VSSSRAVRQIKVHLQTKGKVLDFLKLSSKVPSMHFFLSVNINGTLLTAQFALTSPICPLFMVRPPVS
jgi:hypothetical protein